MYLNYIIGPAGSGKSTLTKEIYEYITSYNDQLDVITLNLDPGVKRLPYNPDIDVRDYVDIDKIMKEEGFGPNGAMIEATERLKDVLDEIKYEIDQFNSPDFVLIDTPGQMELFAFRPTGSFVASSLGFAGVKKGLTFLFDPMMCKKPSGFISTALLAASIQFRFVDIPQVNLLTKCDLIDEDLVQRITEWSSDPNMLEDDILLYEKGMVKEMNVMISRVLPELTAMSEMIPVSSFNHSGIDEYFALIQRMAQSEDSQFT